MNKCLNCSKDVINKYCNTHCKNVYRFVLNSQEYLKNPKRCKKCDGILPYDKRKNIFCCSSCSVTYNNIFYDKKYGPISKVRTLSDSEFKKIINKSSSWKDISSGLGYSEKLNTHTRQVINSRILELDIKLNLKCNSLKYNNKEEIFNKCKNWQSARGLIRKDASLKFKESGQEYKCIVCGYDKHVDIAHVKSVSCFGNDVFLEQINNINNLIPLCPNHHWEYDKGGLDISKYM